MTLRSVRDVALDAVSGLSACCAPFSLKVVHCCKGKRGTGGVAGDAVQAAGLADMEVLSREAGGGGGGGGGGAAALHCSIADGSC